MAVVGHIYGAPQPTEWAVAHGQQAVQYQSQADNAIAASLRAAQDAANRSNQYQLDYSSLAGKIGDLDKQVGALGMYPEALAGLAGSLAPYEGMFNQYGWDLWGQGLNVYGHGNSLMGTGQSILGMNADPNSLAGKYLTSLNNIDPNRYVSMAGADVQQSYNNILGQLLRNMGRQGLDASSGRAMGLQQQLADAMAAAQAGAKTRARQQGITEQNAALAQALGIGSGMVQQGAGVAHTGAQIQTMGGQMHQLAANVLRDQAGIYGDAGRLAQGNVGLAQGNVQLGMQNSLNLTQTNQAGAEILVRAQQNAANYYAQISGGYGALAGSLGLARAQGVNWSSW